MTHRTHRIAVSSLSVGLVLLALTPAASASLAGYWPFDGDALDASGTGNNGTLHGDAGFSATVPAAIGGGMSLAVDGDGDYVNIPADASLNSNVFTLAYWANQNGATQMTGSFERLTSRGGDTFETAVSGDGSVIRYDGAWVNTGYDLPGSGWAHLAWVSDGSNLSLYVDGALAHSTASSVSPSGLLRFGARHNNI